MCEVLKLILVNKSNVHVRHLVYDDNESVLLNERADLKIKCWSLDGVGTCWDLSRVFE